jgi:16S rRNA (cytosine1402-N4)-methyltransferase
MRPATRYVRATSKAGLLGKCSKNPVYSSPAATTLGYNISTSQDYLRRVPKTRRRRLHVPVLVQEMLQYLRPHSRGVYLDGTLGAGGYAEAILDASRPGGEVVGLDLDPSAVNRTALRLQAHEHRFRAVHGGFHEAASILAGLGIEALDGAVLDLGLSSEQLEDPERGFSFRRNGPLDMRFDTTSEVAVLDLLETISVNRLEEILATYGEERYCKKLARGILEARRRGVLSTTQDLANVVSSVLAGRRGKIHPATRTFQALRIAVNRELENLSLALMDIPPLLKPGGRFCVVSYHSLEDRAVKRSFKDRSKEPQKWILVTPKPLRPSTEEMKNNPRSRSARMRVLEAAAAPDSGPSA